MIQNPLRRDVSEGDWSFIEFGRNSKNRPGEELESGIGNLEMVQNHGNLARLKDGIAGFRILWPSRIF